VQSGLKSRISKLHADTISEVSSEIIIKKKDEVLRRVWCGTNKAKVIRIVVKL